MNKMNVKTNLMNASKVISYNIEQIFFKIFGEFISICSLKRIIKLMNNWCIELTTSSRDLKNCFFQSRGRKDFADPYLKHRFLIDSCNQDR
jgi:hypothetical protein